MLSDLNAVAVFAKVVELKNFRAAALALGVPRSTVSVRVAQLEDRLGVRLLERSTRRLRLTEAGEIYYRSVTPALDALALAERGVDRHKAQLSGPLRITATVEGGQYVLAPIAAEYMQLHPEVELQIELSDRRVDLIEENFDLALRSGRLPDSTLIARKLREPTRLRIYGGPRYLAERGVPTRPAQLAQHACLIMTSQSEPDLWTFQIRQKPVRVRVPVRARANSFVVLRELATRGLGIARMPDNIAASAVAAGELRELLTPYLPPPSTWHALFPSARHLSPKLRAFVALLERHYGLKR